MVVKEISEPLLTLLETVTMLPEFFLLAINPPFTRERVGQSLNGKENHVYPRGLSLALRLLKVEQAYRKNLKFAVLNGTPLTEDKRGTRVVSVWQCPV